MSVGGALGGQGVRQRLRDRQQFRTQEMGEIEDVIRSQFLPEAFPEQEAAPERAPVFGTRVRRRGAAPAAEATPQVTRPRIDRRSLPSPGTTRTGRTIDRRSIGMRRGGVTRSAMATGAGFGAGTRRGSAVRGAIGRGRAAIGRGGRGRGRGRGRRR